MKVNIMNEALKNGIEIKEGYIEYINYGITYQNYFKLQHDFITNDYDYSNSDITEEQEEQLHNIIINGKYETLRDNESVYNYLNSAVVKNNSYTPNKEVKANCNERELTIWINTKGFIHFITKTNTLFNNGETYPCNTEYAYNKHKQLKELNSDIIFDKTLDMNVI